MKITELWVRGCNFTATKASSKDNFITIFQSSDWCGKIISNNSIVVSPLSDIWIWDYNWNEKLTWPPDKIASIPQAKWLSIESCALFSRFRALQGWFIFSWIKSAFIAWPVNISIAKWVCSYENTWTFKKKMTSSKDIETTFEWMEKGTMWAQRGVTGLGRMNDKPVTRQRRPSRRKIYNRP